MLRLALRSDDRRVEVKLSSLLPGGIYEGSVEETVLFNGKEEEVVVMKREYFFHGISSEEVLKLFLLPPIYNLFPVGWRTTTLSSSKKSATSTTSHTSLQRWIVEERNASLQLIPNFDMTCDLINSTMMSTAQTRFTATSESDF